MSGRNMRKTAHKTLRWLLRTPGQTFVLCPLAVIVVELALHRGEIVFVPWGCLLLAWGYLQYLLVGNYRLPRAGGGRGMEKPPERIIASGPYRYTRNPMYLGHLNFLAGLAAPLHFCGSPELLHRPPDLRSRQLL